MKEEDFENNVEVWPENWTTVKLFGQLQTQWRNGFRGRIGLDYSPLFKLMDRLGLSSEGWEQMFEDIQEMESAALKVLHDN